MGGERWTTDLKTNFQIALNAGCKELKVDYSNSASRQQHRHHVWLGEQDDECR
jgi:hypothetical protein